MNKSTISIFLSIFLISGSLRPKMSHFADQQPRSHTVKQIASNDFNFTSQSDGFFFHGLGGYHGHNKYYEWLLGNKMSLAAPKLPNGRKSCLAQFSEQKIARSFMKSFPGQKKLVVGVSRGAALSLHMAIEPDVGIVIAESPFDRVESVVNQIIYSFPVLGYVAYLPFVASMGHLVTPWVHDKYNRWAKQPIDIVQNIPKNKPVLLICSKGDRLIPWESTKRLYEKMRLSGHNHVYLLVLEKGAHAYLVHKSFFARKDGRIGVSRQFAARGMYRSVVHAFLKKYGYPHDESLAAQGAGKLEQCRPEVVINHSTFG